MKLPLAGAMTLLLGAIAPVTAQLQGACTLVSTGAYFVVRVNGDSIGRHDTEVTMAARVLSEHLKRPGVAVTATRAQTVRASGCLVAPARVDTLRIRDTLLVRDTLIVSPPPIATPPPPPTPPVDTVVTPPVDNPPVAAFSWVCPTLTCTLDASSSTDDGTIVSYAWNLGRSPDPTGTGKILSATYPHTGERTVTLTVTDNGGKSGSITKTLTVGAAPPPPPPPPVDTVIVTPPPPPPPPVVVPPLAGWLPAHPRVWMTPARIVHLKAQRAANAVRWTRVLAAADGQVGRTTFNIVDLDKVPDLCLVYLATDDARYADRAGYILTQYATEANNLTGDSGYGFRFNLPLVTMGLDWCYNSLTVAQRQQFATWLMNRADWVWPESNPARLNMHGTGNPAINYYWGFMMTGPAALAASGDDTGTGTLSGADRATFHANLVLNRWNGQVANFFAGEGAGGAWADGTGYDSSWRLGAFTDAFFTAGRPTAHPFIAQSLAWRLHSTTPGYRFKVPFGAQPRVSDGSMFTYDRLSALYPLASSGADAALRANVYAWLDGIGQVPSSEFNATATLADELLRYAPDSLAAPSAPPNGFVAPGPGYVIYRQSWSDPATTLLTFASGPVADGGSREANGLSIWKGGYWITANANIYSASGVEAASANYNTLTVGGVGQQLYGGNRGVLSGPLFTDTLVRFGGQAKDAYGYVNQWANTRFVDDYRREVAYFPAQDVIVVVDRATVRDASAAKVWRWHSKNPATISGNTFVLSNPAGDQRCHATVVHPTATLGQETLALGNGGLASSSAVTVTMVGQATDVVVTVLQCNGQPPLVPLVTTGAQVTVSIAGRTVRL